MTSLDFFLRFFASKRAVQNSALIFSAGTACNGRYNTLTRRAVPCGEHKRAVQNHAFVILSLKTGSKGRYNISNNRAVQS